MSKSYIQLKQSLQKVHSTLEAKLGDVGQDIIYAQKLEKFFNYILYNKPLPENTIESAIDNILSVEAANQIKQKMNLVDNSLNPQANWKTFENSILNIVKQLVNNSLGDFQKRNKLLASKNINSGFQVVGGKTTSTVDIAKALVDLPKDLQETIMNKLISSGQVVKKQGRYYAKQAKNDVALISAGIDFSKIEGGSLFENLSFTIKNYNENMILEQVNLDKAYLAMVNSIGQQWRKSLLRYYKYGDALQQQEIYEHLAHFRNVFALTGLGSQYLTVNNKGDFQIFSRFLINKAWGGTGLKVYSTKALLQHALGKPNTQGQALFKTYDTFESHFGTLKNVTVLNIYDD